MLRASLSLHSHHVANVQPHFPTKRNRLARTIRQRVGITKPYYHLVIQSTASRDAHAGTQG